MKHTKPKTKRTYKRTGRTTKDEKEVVKAVVRQAGGDLPIDETRALAKVFKRPVGTVKKLIAQAKENLSVDAEFYVDTHRQVVETAFIAGAATFNDKLLETARKGSAWAIENISGEGKRLVEKQESGPQGTRIMIGVRLSNMTAQPETTINLKDDAVDVQVLE